ncbi:DUF937 domain-containing protein [Pseudorhodoplanes sinuspersici]|uniref:Uncharacterized protein n=1 Tax=Pseudorhodoplanes sinuspersici TaxID=1235591 RepID=A0A1W6ZNM6_9HYPH|nr:DUF937 domain-containing protein [Pseudorhodoplanes sinuspersici]ARP98875.1 hypothetical protein CAK95_07130 [Pseudorhodoplanes sinuspersici]RKE69502.1 uncharacterized protein DUF937 [Pseudorhodoplanes sinuspersici]
MAVNLVSLIMQFITPSLVSKMGGALGLDRDQTQKAVGVGVPAILAGLASAAAKPQNQQKLSDMMVQQSTTLDQAKSAINEGRPGAVAETGNNLLSSLLGGETVNMLAGAVGRFAGIDPSTTKSLLGMLAPLTAGVVGQQQRSQGLNASGLANLLTSHSSQIMSAMPAGFASLLGSTGLLNGLGDSWRSSAAAANRISDMPGQAAASAGQLAQASAKSVSASHWPWVIAALAVLAGLGWYLFNHDESFSVAERPLSPTSRLSETTGVGVSDQKLTDLAAELTSSVSATRSALQGISDPLSARAALPKLQQVSTQFDNISNAISSLPPNARRGVASVVTRSMPMLNQLFDRVLASPQTAELTKPTIDALRAKLDTLAKS